MLAREAKKPVPAVPRLHFLGTNYRTHRGVLNLSTSLTLAIKVLFPRSIDDVPTGVAAERSEQEVSIPLLVRGLDTAAFAAFLAATDWTADQVVLVRDDDSKARLEEAYKVALREKETSTRRQPDQSQRMPPQKAIVLTALESKGLEFCDTLIFGTS
eukprot:tig00021254_g19689.t1